MKKVLFIFGILACIVQGTFAGHIIKAPGDVIDVLSGIRIGTILDSDTIFIEGGTGDVTLQFGVYNASYSYDWNTDGGSQTTWQVPFTYALSGRQVACTRWSPAVDEQQVYIIYRSSALKPSTPSGASSVCVGSSGNYTSTSTNADSYRWTISPGTAGTTSSTTGTANITWSASWTGTATVTVEGKKGSTYSPVSDGLDVVVGTVPAKPTISGDEFVKISTFKTYAASGSGTTAWTLNPASGLATKSASGDDVVLNFSAVGNFTLTVTRTNSCGTSPSSDAFAVEVIDPSSISTLTAQVTSLKSDTTAKGIASRATIASLNTDKASLSTQLTNETNLYNKTVTDSTTSGTNYRNIISGLKSDKVSLTTQLTNETNLYNNTVTDSTTSGTNYRSTISLLKTQNIDFSNDIQNLQKNVTAYQDSIGYFKRTYSFLDDGSIVLDIKTVSGDYSIKVYPNPTWGPTTITSSEIIQKIEVLNMNGQTVFTNTPNRPSVQIDLTELTSEGSFYIIKVTNSKGLGNFKLIRTH